ncbi:hypothetical protein FNH05_00675 [Amycolatopsis rhizosphaerae]|uniref:Uncharacterized protein n=2 Tax=Amycolatopsis rhizosphaerae TaxID=2053003 RepID=A0A558DNQ2_9PSEU|nr:hypothetical protein FNH05_00675 [Amycolatopsis rhizosphaerae]
MWIKSLRDLELILHGYGVALSVHGIDDTFVFAAGGGAFAKWVQARHGWSMACGWARAIEDHAEEEEPLALFYRLLDDYRSRRSDPGRNSDVVSTCQ